MLLLTMCVLMQPDNPLFGKLDVLFSQQVQELEESISNMQALRIEAAAIYLTKWKLASLKKSFALTIPDFDFSKGVEIGDLGNIGYHIVNADNMKGVRPDGTPAREGQKRERCNFKVLQINGKDTLLARPPYDKGEKIIVSNIPEKRVVEKNIYLSKYIAEYLGKKDGYKQYQIVGDEATYKAWQKYRSARK